MYNDCNYHSFQNVVCIWAEVGCDSVLRPLVTWEEGGREIKGVVVFLDKCTITVCYTFV